MKTLSVHAPWAWAIVNGYKLVENRPRRYNYRGPLAIHASLSKRSDEAARAAYQAAGVPFPSDEDLDALRGKVLGIVNLVDCVEYGEGMADDPWASGPFCLILADAQRVEPVTQTGALSLWTCNAELVPI